MAKNRVMEISALNVVIHPHSAQRYIDLIYALHRLRVAAPIRGDYRARLGTAREINPEKPLMGIRGDIFRYFDLDMSARWFNIARGQIVKEEEKSSIKIPPEYRPHFSFFHYVFFPASHRLVFESRDGSDRLTPGAAARVMEELTSRKSIVDAFGPVQITVEPRVESVESLLKLNRMRRLEIVLTRPNSDVLDSAETTLMKRLEKMNARSEHIEVLADKGETLLPDETLKTLARVAGSNGVVKADGYTSDGRPLHESTKDHPLIERIEYPSTRPQREVFEEVASTLMSKIAKPN